MGRKSNSARVALGIAVAPALLAAVSACDSTDNSADDQVAYCVDKDNKVVDDTQCGSAEHNGGGGVGGGIADNPLFWYILLSNSGPRYGPGMIVPPPPPGRPAYPRAAANNPSARSSIGLPSTGKVTSGSSVGGLGKGASGGSVGRGGSSGASSGG